MTDDEIRNMSLIDAERYTNEHPEDAWRIAKIQGEFAVMMLKKSIFGGNRMEKP